MNEITLYEHEHAATVFFRPIEPQPVETEQPGIWGESTFRLHDDPLSSGRTAENVARVLLERSPYTVGEPLLCREDWGYCLPAAHLSRSRFCYKADSKGSQVVGDWQPASTMPDKFIRRRPTITSVEVVRIADLLETPKGWDEIRATGIDCPIHRKDPSACVGYCKGQGEKFCEWWNASFPGAVWAWKIGVEESR